MKRKIMALCLVGLMAGSATKLSGAENSTFIKPGVPNAPFNHKDILPMATIPYGTGLVVGLIPILIPSSFLTGEGPFLVNMAWYHADKPEVQVMIGSFAAGVATGLAAWYAAISYWIK